MSFSGRLATYPLADLLQWLDHHAADGRLTLERGDARRVLDVVAGRVVFSSSTLPRERLGTYLAEQKLVAREAMHELMARNYCGDGNLTTLLLTKPVIEREALADAVTRLAEHIVFDSFSWTDGTFEFDPEFRPLELLPIKLSLESQVLAFRGAKQLDDTARLTPSRKKKPAPLATRIETDEEAAFWRVMEAAAETDGALDALAVRDRLGAFRAFVVAARARCRRAPEPLPIFAETVDLLAPGRGEVDLTVRLAALDPYLAANLLLLGNSLATDRSLGFPTPRSAVDVAGAIATRVFVERLARRAAPRRSSDEPLEVALWRSAIGTAVAAARLADRVEIERDEAYDLGLMSGLGLADLLPLCLEIPMPSPAFRAALLGELQPQAGRLLAHRFALPTALSDVLASDGRIAENAAPHLQLILMARELSPTGALGHAWQVVDGDPQDLFSKYRVPAGWADELHQDCAKVLAFLKLPE